MKTQNLIFKSILLFPLLFLNWNFIQTSAVDDNQRSGNSLICDCIVEAQDDVELQLGTAHQIETIFNCLPDDIENISWSPVDFLSCTNCAVPVVEPLEDKCYTMTVTWTDGCISTEEFCVFIRSCDSPFSENEINSITPQSIGNEAEIELEIARTQFVHIEIVDDDEVEYTIWEGFLKAGLQKVTLDFSAVPSGSHQLRVRIYPEDKFINIVKL